MTALESAAAAATKQDRNVQVREDGDEKRLIYSFRGMGLFARPLNNPGVFVMLRDIIQPWGYFEGEVHKLPGRDFDLAAACTARDIVEEMGR